jgi:hypothetical protein
MWPFSEMSLPTATLIGTIANWALLACLLGGVLSTFVIVKTTDVKEEHWDRDRDASRERIKELTKETTRLSTEGDEARAAIAGANARALEAQAELARFRAPRSISATDRPKLVSALSAYAGTNAAVYILGDGPEPNGLALSILGMLREAHWEVLPWNWTGAGAATGIVVLFKPGSTSEIEAICEALVSALNSAHITAAKEPWPGNWEQFGGMLNGPNPPSPTAAPIRIVIGTKPQ